ncbi:ABC transporter ATP-binding protein/permease [Bacteroidota bacterium]|nr:ABC transporter ATP-binding protein/permease [Bacteroidota bacterium]MDC3230109.1 ABC transporter ATP-binding protein/permease [Bacteroidota bacterium]
MKALKYLNKFFLKHKFLLITGLIFVTMSNFFALYPAEFVKVALDKVLVSLEQPNDFNEVKSEIIKYSMLILLFSLGKGVFMFLMRQTIIVMSRRIEFDLKNEIYSKYQSLSMSFYNKNNTGDLMNRISEDVSRVRMYLGPAIMYFINISVLFSLVIFKMFSISEVLSLYVLAPLPVLAISVFFVSSKINFKSDKVQKQLSRITSIAQENYSGIYILKSFAYEKLSLKKFRNNCDKYIKKQLDLIKIEALFYPLIVTLIGTSTLLTIYIGGIEVSKGHISTGTIAEFIIYVNMLSWPVASIGWLTSLIQRAEASQKRINEFLSDNSTIKNIGKQKLASIEKIEFKNIFFKYEKSKNYALKNISFKLKKGETMGIFGKTGSGKSTILALITRIYDFSKGDILLNNKPIHEYDLEILRRKFGYVPQDGYLFSGTIEENISYSSNKIDRKKLNLSTENAAIDEEVKKFPNKYKTKIGERGVQLSGGQKQRISIARAFYTKPEIFIFDDCLSAVDSITERKIVKTLNKLKSKTTSIIVSHRIMSLVKCDNILVLDEGKIIESGKHTDLIKKNGFYFKMFTNQLHNKTNVS